MNWKYIVPVITVLLLTGCSGREEEQNQEEIIRPVRVMSAVAAEQTAVRQFSGITAAEEELVLAFRVSGRIASVQVSAGDKVKKGATLMTLDHEEFDLELQRSAAALESARVQASATEASYRRIRELYQNDSASRNQLESAQAAYEAAQASYVAAKAQMDRAEIQLSYTVLKAPFDGDVGQLPVDRGEVVAAGQAAAGFSSSRINIIRFSVSEDVVSLISSGMACSVSVPSLGLEEVPGTIKEISSGKSQNGSLFPVKMTLMTDYPGLRAGMSCSVNLELSSQSRPVFYVPPQSVLEDSKGRYLFVARPVGNSNTDAVVNRLTVETGDLEEQGIEVLDGLESGDLVITAGMSRLYNGMPVRISREL